MEGRPIHSVSVSGSGNKGQPLVQQLPLVWIVCGLHAREWVSPQACVHILQALIQVRLSESWLRFGCFQNACIKMKPKLKDDICRQITFVCRICLLNQSCKRLLSALCRWQTQMATSSACPASWRTGWQGRTRPTLAALSHFSTEST